MKPSRVFHMLLAVLAVWILAAPDAQAYIDPGSGSLLWQLLLAGLFGAMFWVHRLRLWLAATFARFMKRKAAKGPE